VKAPIIFGSPEGSTNQSINHQGRLTLKASAAATYTPVMAKASALAGVEGYQLNPSQGAGLPISGVLAKGSPFQISLQSGKTNGFNIRSVNISHAVSITWKGV
jgi:hypothetical protein